MGGKPFEFPTPKKDTTVTCVDGRFLCQVTEGVTIIIQNKKYIATSIATVTTFNIAPWTWWRYLYYHSYLTWKRRILRYAAQL